MVTRDEELKWAYLLDPCFELTNSAGKPLTDGYIEVYIAGTRNKYYCASDFAGTLHPFQIPLDSLGSNIVLANPDNAYDVYVYNRFGNLIMSRYNVTPADGGAVISNTERINELEELVVSAVTGLQGQIDDINEALDGKKDKQEEYSVTLTPTQTVSAIMQNENGEIEVIYQEIDLPEEVPNVDIVSPASTINITTHIDEETNTKTFSIDLSDLGHLEYGQYMATQDVYTGANMFRIKGNLETTQDGKIQLHKGNSYHITVRGYYTCSDLSNTSDTLNYIEYSTFTPMPVNVDNTVAGPQYFEISYDIFKLSADTNYYIAFAANAGKVSNLTVEVHSLSNLSILDPGALYQEGWGIDIVSSVISVDPDIFNDYSTHTEVYEATVTAIQAATSVVPEIEQSDWAEDDPEAQSYIKNKPDLDVYATHDEVYESAVSSIQLVTGLIPEQLEAGQYISIEDNTINVTGLQPEGDYATNTEVYNATVTAIETATAAIPDSEEVQFEELDITQFAQASAIPDVSDFATHTEVYEAVITGVQLATSVIPDQLEAGQYVSIENNVITVTGLQPEGDYATNADVYEATVTAVNIATAAIPESEEVQFEEINLANYALASAIPDVSDFTTHTEVYDATVTAIETVTAMIPSAQVQSDWNQTNSAQPDYIKNKPNLNQYATDTEVSNAIVTAIEAVTAMIPAAQVQSDWTETNTADPSYIQNKPDEYNLVAGQNIGIFVAGDNVTIAASGADLSNYATDTEVYNATVTAIQTATGLIPEAQVQSDWNETNTSSKAYIKNKPNLNQYATDVEAYNATVTAINLVTGMIPNYTAGDNIVIDNNEIALSDVVQIDARPDAASGFLKLGNVVHWGGQDYGPGWIIRSHTDNNKDYLSYNTSDQGQQEFFWGEYAADRENNSVSGESYISIHEGDIVYRAGEFQETGDLPVIWSCSGMRYDIDRLQEAVTAIPEAQVQSDWNETNSSSKAYIKNKPEEESVEFEEINISNYALASSIPDVSNFATYTDVHDATVTAIETVTAMIPDAQVQSDWTESDDSDPAYIQHKPTEINLIAGDNVTIEVTGVSAIISSLGGGSTYTAGNHIGITNDEISVTGIGNLVAGNNITITESGNDITISAQGGGGATYTAGEYISINNNVIAVTGLEPLPESEEVEFEELAITQFAQASAIPTIQLNSSDQVTGIDGHAIAGGGGGSTYTAGQYISIDGNDVISVTGLQVAGSYATTSDISDMATKTWVGNQGYLTAVPNTYATKVYVDGAVSGKQDKLTAGSNISISGNTIAVTGMPASPVQSDWSVTNTSSLAYIKNKPTIPAAPVQSNWNETNSSSLAYIKNKPTIPAAPVQSNWNETNSSSLAYIKNKPDLSVYATTSAMETAINTSKAQFDRITRTGNTDISLLTTTGVGSGKLTVNLGSIFNTSYNMNEWIYCETAMWWGNDKSVRWFTFSARLNNIVATQWSQVNNAIQLKTTNAVFMSGIRAICGDSWNPTTLVITNDSAWTSTANVIRRDIRNSSTTDNNTYYIWFSGYIYVPV